MLRKWLQPSLWETRKQTVWVREERKARITVWVGMKEKEMGKGRRTESGSFCTWVCGSGRARVEVPVKENVCICKRDCRV